MDGYLFVCCVFVFMYSLEVITNILINLYYVGCHIKATTEEEKDKNIPEAVKRLYS